MMHDGTVHARWRYTQFKGAGGREEARAWGRRARCQPARGSRLEFRVEEWGLGSEDESRGLTVDN